MISRRSATIGIITYPLLMSPLIASEKIQTDSPGRLDQLTYPPFDALEKAELYGFRPAEAAQKAKALAIEAATINGPRPFDVAQSFVDRFFLKDPEAISQWPEPTNWNPLVVNFFSSTKMKVNNDMVAWCAAFANWCIERAGRQGTESASSQSFLTCKNFKPTASPVVGDLAIFTCYNRDTGDSLGLGHVAFVKELPDNGKIVVVGGNQSSDGHSSIVSDSAFSVENVEVRRHVDGKLVPCVMRLNTYLAIN